MATPADVLNRARILRLEALARAEGGEVAAEVLEGEPSAAEVNAAARELQAEEAEPGYDLLPFPW